MTDSEKTVLARDDCGAVGLVVATILLGVVAVAGVTATAVLLLTRPPAAGSLPSPIAPSASANSAPSASSTAAPTVSPSPDEDEPARPATVITLTRWQSVPTHPPVEQFETGDCAASYITGRANGYRCFAGDRILDPCIGVDPAILVCPAAPWSKEYVGVYYRGVNEYGGTPQTAGTPWGIQLTSGQRCSLLSGATAAIGSRRLNYDCGKAGAVYGEPDRGRVWTVKLESRTAPGELKTVPLKRVWY